MLAGPGTGPATAHRTEPGGRESSRGNGPLSLSGWAGPIEVREAHVRAHQSPVPSPTWRAFLRNRAGEILACDFFTIPTATFQTVTGFLVMELDRRRILAIGATRPRYNASAPLTFCRQARVLRGRVR